MPPKNARVAIWNALRNLEESNFRDFCDELAQPDGEPRIWRSDVEKKSRAEVAKFLVSRCSSGAVDRAITTLRDIGCNDEAEELAAEADADRSQPAPRRGRSRSPHRATKEADLPPPQRDISRLRTPPPEIPPNAQDTAGSSTSTDIYPVTSNSIKNRVALLITNITFTDKNNNRPGAEKDEENMEKLLPTLGYEVVKHRDLTAQKMKDALVEFSKHPKLKETDSVFVVISSHGKLGAVLGVDSDELKVDDIFDKLNTESCPALMDKPKIIIIQACRGKEKGSVRVEADEVSVRDTEEDVLRHKHKEKNFLALRSSTPHTVSYRHRSQGSFLIRFTVDVFQTNVLKDHIEDLVQKVMKRFEEVKDLPDEFKQMPTKDRCSLIRHFFLFPGDLKQHYPVVGQRDQSPGPSVSVRCSSGAVDRAITTLRDIGCNDKAEEPAAEADAERSQPAPRRGRSRSPHRAKPSLSRDDSSPSPRNDPKELLSSVRPDFVDNVSDAVLDQLLDRLLLKKLLNSGEVESAKQKHRPDKARYVVDTVLRKGPKAASFLIKEYCELDPCSELCDKLKL